MYKTSPEHIWLFILFFYKDNVLYVKMKGIVQKKTSYIAQFTSEP